VKVYPRWPVAEVPAEGFQRIRATVERARSALMKRPPRSEIVGHGPVPLLCRDDPRRARRRAGRAAAGRALAQPAGTAGAGAQVTAQPYLWPWREIEPRLRLACDLVGVDRGASRRTLRLCTPGLALQAATHTIHASLQIVTQGEVAPAHRHSNNAFRFIIRGSASAHTTVEGERFDLERHDLILTPPWTWHDHTNDGDEPVYWIDGHDLPLLRSLSTEFFETYERRQQEAVFPSGHWSDIARDDPHYRLPPNMGGVPYIYRASESLAALKSLGVEAHDPTEGVCSPIATR